MLLDGMGDAFFGQLSCPCPLPVCHTPHSLMAGQCEKQKGPGAVQALLSNQGNIPVLPTLFLSQFPNSLIPAPVEKINSLPAKTSRAVISTPPQTNVGQGKEHSHNLPGLQKQCSDSPGCYVQLKWEEIPQLLRSSADPAVCCVPGSSCIPTVLILSPLLVCLTLISYSPADGARLAGCQADAGQRSRSEIT